MNKLNQKGLSLIEVMIALAVFSFGLLALAALMASGLKYNTSALHRSYATNQAYDMADRMRANRLGLIGEYYNGVSDSSGDPCDPSDDSIDSSDDPIDSSDDLICCARFNNDVEIDCTPEQMAQYDNWEWDRNNGRLLPEGTGTVSPKSIDSDIYTITVTWKTSTAAETESFVFEFQP
tara:strand:+ start:125 stop:658 length:534 start_codon:yes stop_codon:yes gene_type:complete